MALMSQIFVASDSMQLYEYICLFYLLLLCIYLCIFVWTSDLIKIDGSINCCNLFLNQHYSMSFIFTLQTTCYGFSVFLSFCLFLNTVISLSVSLSFRLSVFLSFCLFIFLSFCHLRSSIGHWRSTQIN